MVDYVLETAIKEHKIVTIIYQQADKFTERSIRVTGIKGDKVEAYCYLRHQHRVFKKQNILSAALRENN